MVKESPAPAPVAGDETKTVLRSLRTYPTREKWPCGPYHDFWLLEEKNNSYDDFQPLLGRKDALVRIPDDLLSVLTLGLKFVPTVDAGGRDLPMQYGLIWNGPTVVNWVGAQAWAQVMSGYAQLFSVGPTTLRLDAWWFPPGDSLRHPDVFDVMLVERDPFVEDLLVLAQWGDQAATGRYFILHLGI